MSRADVARCTDDFELLVAIQTKNLSSPSCFLTLAGLFREQGRTDEALRWVEQRIAAFPNERNDDLLSLAIDLQLALGLDGMWRWSDSPGSASSRPVAAVHSSS